MLHRPRVLVLAALFAAAPVMGCADSASTSASADPLSVDGAEAHRLVAAGAVLLDVRTPEEFADGHIDGAVNLPLDQLDGSLSTLTKDKTIVVYCASGARAGAATETLARAGFKVRDLGRMSAWN